MIKYIVGIIIGIALTFFTIDYVRVRKQASDAIYRAKKNYTEIYGDVNTDNGLWDARWELRGQINHIHTQLWGETLNGEYCGEGWIAAIIKLQEKVEKLEE